MKKIMKITLLILLVLAIFPNKAYASGENVLEVKFKNYNDLDELSGIEGLAFDYLSNEYFNIEQIYSDDGETSTARFFVKESDKIFYEDIYNNSNNSSTRHFILDDFTVEDTITHIFTEEEKAYFFDNPYYSALNDYDGVKFVFSDVVKNEVFISKIVLQESTSGALINNKPKANNLNIDVDVKFLDVTDYVLYKATIKNNTDKDYLINNETKFGDSEYIKYEFSFDNDDNSLLAGQSKTMYVKISYNKEIPAELLSAGNYSETKALEVELLTEVGDTTNPQTGDVILTKITILLISAVLLIIMIKIEKVRKAMIFVIAALIIIPTVANAIEKINITINSKIEIGGVKKYCYGSYEIDDVTGEETFVSNEYDYKDVMTWKKYSESSYYNGIELPNTLQHNNFPGCTDTPTTASNPLSNLLNQSQMNCDGTEEVDENSYIQDSSVGCYYFHDIK